ncbi:MAG: 4Fe-4S dicluster domain-containing protein [Thermoplasmata archaeon]
MIGLAKIWHGFELVDTKWFPEINYDKCSNCGMCLLACGNKVFLYSENENKFIVGNPYNCVLGCTTCAKICPEDAISFPDDPKKFVLSLLMKYKIYPKVREELNERLQKYPDHEKNANDSQVNIEPKKEFSIWHGMDRKEIKWYPSIDMNKCTGCGLCVVTCSEKRNVFGYDRAMKKAFVLNPTNCMVGCNNCQVSCVWNAISFPDFSLVKNLVKNVLEINRELIKEEIIEKIKQQGLKV